MNEPLDNKVPKTGMSEEKSRKLKHVKVYDRLYAQILSGEYPRDRSSPASRTCLKRWG
ncbi:hypothetical protein LC724_10965 [Blautia sp. RD014234]|nr:hypothetical protein [Blautia parvula]